MVKVVEERVGREVSPATKWGKGFEGLAQNKFLRAGDFTEKSDRK